MAVIDLKYTAPPTVSRFMQSDHFHRILAGPVGGGKSVGCCFEVLRRAVEMPPWDRGIRRSKWAVVRNTMKELRNTTLETWMRWMRDLGTWHESKFMFHLKFGDVDAKILFLPLDSPGDIGRLLSLELTGMWTNEGREIPVSLLADIKGRLGRYPAYKDRPVDLHVDKLYADHEGMNTLWYWAGLIQDTNPPEIDSDFYRLMEHEPQVEGDAHSIIDCDVFRQPSGLSPEAENKENLRPGYYENLAKNPTDWVNTYVHGHYAASQAGKPVYANTFRQDRHVSLTPLKIDPILPVVIGFDTGLTPAATFKQMGLDGRVRVLREAAAFDMGMKRFIQHHLRPIIKNFFADNPLIFIGDPAGVRRGDGDENSAFKVLKEAFTDDGAIVKAASTNDPKVRIQATEQMLCQYPDGDPMYLIDPSCKRLIEGLRSKYRYPKMKQSGIYSESPEKNDWGHLVEGDQYSNMFLLSGKYSPSDYLRVTADPYGFTRRQPYRPAQREGY